MYIVKLTLRKNGYTTGFGLHREWTSGTVGLPAYINTENVSNLLNQLHLDEFDEINIQHLKGRLDSNWPNNFITEELKNVIVGAATSKIEKVSSKIDEVIDEVIDKSNTQITVENGFKNIVMLDPGTSPIGYLDALDSSGLERFENLDCGKYE